MFCCSFYSCLFFVSYLFSIVIPFARTQVSTKSHILLWPKYGNCGRAPISSPKIFSMIFVKTLLRRILNKFDLRMTMHDCHIIFSFCLSFSSFFMHCWWHKLQIRLLFCPECSAKRFFCVPAFLKKFDCNTRSTMTEGNTDRGKLDFSRKLRNEPKMLRGWVAYFCSGNLRTKILAPMKTFV